MQRARELAKQEREAAAKAQDEERRQKTVGRAHAIFDHASKNHENRMKAIGQERRAVEQKADAESKRWEKEKRD